MERAEVGVHSPRLEAEMNTTPSGAANTCQVTVHQVLLTAVLAKSTVHGRRSA